jgi:hypothetical protein
MATFKAVVMAHHKKEDGTYNVKIRVAHNRVTRYIKTNILPVHSRKSEKFIFCLAA